MPTTPQPLRARRSPWPAAPPQAAPVVDYPDLGVEPMTPDHYDAMTDTVAMLQSRYASRDDVYVRSSITMYYVEGSNRHAVLPDVFVAFGVERDRRRRVWLAWEEGKLADFVLEVASKDTYLRDQREKRAIYESQGVTEYWQFDPTGDYLTPVLQGHRLNASGVYESVPLATAPDGTLCGESRVLLLRLCPDGDRLRLFDPATGEFLATNADKDETIAEQNATIAAQGQALAEQRRARAALEAELTALKRERGTS